ncbi:hypothetical protein [Paenibacillus vini]|uniref:Uncharacterized protein n=1 Tax=Paenibacillus vini TaxID=1476024 RepID=A0ABQ4M781_9BACL|nr:hypothetical protein [Paenibacillus vini]GIP51830.1 hypothetical protein J42TS3_08650 [Paenibacillus vini]
MNNLERLKLETKGITLSPEELSVYLAEEGITNPDAEYDASSSTSKRKIYAAALSILNSVANNISLMKNYKEDDISVSDFSESLSQRIDQLERKLRSMAINESETGSNTFMLFNR